MVRKEQSKEGALQAQIKDSGGRTTMRRRVTRLTTTTKIGIGFIHHVHTTKRAISHNVFKAFYNYVQNYFTQQVAPSEEGNKLSILNQNVERIQHSNPMQ